MSPELLAGGERPFAAANRPVIVPNKTVARQIHEEMAAKQAFQDWRARNAAALLAAVKENREC